MLPAVIGRHADIYEVKRRGVTRQVTCRWWPLFQAAELPDVAAPGGVNRGIRHTNYVHGAYGARGVWP
jgi:hypothetical protein